MVKDIDAKKDIIPMDVIDACSTEGYALLDISKIIPYGYKLENVTFNNMNVPHTYMSHVTIDGRQMIINVKVHNVPFVEGGHVLIFYLKRNGNIKITVENTPGVYLSGGSMEIPYGYGIDINVVSMDNNKEFVCFEIEYINGFKEQWEHDHLIMHEITSDLIIRAIVKTKTPTSCGSGEITIFDMYTDGGKPLTKICESFDINGCVIPEQPLKKTNVRYKYYSNNPDERAPLESTYMVDSSRDLFKFTSQLTNVFQYDIIKVTYENLAVDGFECAQVCCKLIKDGQPPQTLEIQKSTDAASIQVTPDTGSHSYKYGEKVNVSILPTMGIFGATFTVFDLYTGEVVDGPTHIGILTTSHTYTVTMTSSIRIYIEQTKS